MKYLKKYKLFESLSDYRVSEDDFWFRSTYLESDVFTDEEIKEISRVALSIEPDYEIRDMGVYPGEDKIHIEISWDDDIREINIVEIMKWGDEYHVVSNEAMVAGSRKYKFDNLSDMLNHMGELMDF